MPRQLQVLPPASWAPGKHLTTVCVQTRWKEGGVQARGGGAKGTTCVMLVLLTPTKEERGGGKSHWQPGRYEPRYLSLEMNMESSKNRPELSEILTF